MSVAEMKIEVIKKISNLNDESVLKEVLALLQEGNENGQDSLNLSRTYDVIKEQYGDVLQKLAQ